VDERLKRRLVGAGVLVSLAVIFLPMLLEERGPRVSIDSSNIPPKPPVDEEYHSRILPLPDDDDEPLITPLTPEDYEPPPLAAGPDPKEEQEGPRLGISAWVVQVASLSNHGNAEALVADLRKRDHSAFLEQVYVNGKQMYRIRVGPEADKERARAEAELIFKEFKLRGQVVRYP